MATIKAFTDLVQSRELAKILPLETSDMIYTMVNGYHTPFVRVETVDELDEDDICAWTLAALLKLMPKFEANEPMLRKLYYISEPTERYICQYSLTDMTSEYDNPVDACVEMIIHLHELKML